LDDTFQSPTVISYNLDTRDGGKVPLFSMLILFWTWRVKIKKTGGKQSVGMQGNQAFPPEEAILRPILHKNTVHEALLHKF
jgi:hypothetical protein